MDNTTVTIIGMIAAFMTAFITSFFAEPVKNYFQHKTKLHHLRMALYKELVSNYLLLEVFDGKDTDANTLSIYAEIAIRNESYKHALEKNLTEFYELREAMAINSLYGTLNMLCKLHSVNLPTIGQTLPAQEIPKFFNAMRTVFLETMAARVYEERLNNRILRKLLNPSAYNELVNKGKEYAEKGYSKDEEQ